MDSWTHGIGQVHYFPLSPTSTISYTGGSRMISSGRRSLHDCNCDRPDGTFGTIRPLPDLGTVLGHLFVSRDVRSDVGYYRVPFSPQRNLAIHAALGRLIYFSGTDAATRFATIAEAPFNSWVRRSDDDNV